MMPLRCAMFALFRLLDCPDVTLSPREPRQGVVRGAQAKLVQEGGPVLGAFHELGIGGAAVYQAGHKDGVAGVELLVHHAAAPERRTARTDRKSTRLNSSHSQIS